MKKINLLTVFLLLLTTFLIAPEVQANGAYIPRGNVVVMSENDYNSGNYQQQPQQNYYNNNTQNYYQEQQAYDNNYQNNYQPTPNTQSSQNQYYSNNNNYQQANYQHPQQGSVYYQQPKYSGNPYQGDIQAMKNEMEYAKVKKQYTQTVHENPHTQEIMSIRDNTELEQAKNDYKLTKSEGRMITTREVRDYARTGRDVLHTIDSVTNTASRIHSFTHGHRTWSNIFPNY